MKYGFCVEGCWSKLFKKRRFGFRNPRYQARVASHKVDGNEDIVGPDTGTRFWRNKQLGYWGSLNRREMACGVDGFQSLVNWPENLNVELTQQIWICIDMDRAKEFAAEEWIIDFVRQCILLAGWTIVDQGEEIPETKKTQKVYSLGSYH